MVFKKDLVVLQLSVRYCNNGGAINPENPGKEGEFLKESEKESKKGPEASQYYRPGKLTEIVLSSSRTKKNYGAKRGHILTENIVKVQKKQLASLKTIWNRGVQFTDPVRHVLQKAAVKIALLWD